MTAIMRNTPNVTQLANSYTNHTQTASTSIHNTYWTTTSSTVIDSNLIIRTNPTFSLSADQMHGIALALLNSKGVRLKDGFLLKIKDGKPFLEFNNRHHPIKKLHHKGIMNLSSYDNVLESGVVLKTKDGSYFEIDKNGCVVDFKYENAKEKVINVESDSLPLYESLAFNNFGDIHIPEGSKSKTKITLPNGTVVSIEPDESITINDSDAKILYKTKSVREFNPYLNASDLLEEFISYCAKQKISKKDFSELPISLFILWLIVRAAEADEDPVDEVLPLLTTAVKKRKVHSHRCKCCGKFLTKKYEQHQISFCNTDHMNKYLKEKMT